MKDLFQRISAFFMAAIMSVLGLFGVKQDFYHRDEPAQTQEEVEVQGDWLLEGVPSFDAGYYSASLFPTGTGLFDDTAAQTESDFEDGDLSRSAVSKVSEMQLVRKTTLQDALAYGEKLEHEGYTQTYSYQIENNFYYAYALQDSSIYYYFNGNTGVTRVIDDCCNTVPLQTFSDWTQEPEPDGEEPQPTDDAPTGENEPSTELDALTEDLPEEPDEPPRPTVYQFSYPYRDAEHVGKNNYGSNGMLYAVALSDGRLIVIDGGNRWQASEQNVTEFFNFLHYVSNTPDDEPLRIAMWYGTHSHGDHNAFFYKLLRRYCARIVLERAMFNFPADSMLTKNTYSTRIRSILATRYPALQYIKARSGYSFRLQDAFCEILYSHEDMVGAKDARAASNNINESCCVLKMTIGERSFLFPGDSLKTTQSVLLQNFTAKTLHADVLQASHHLLENLPELYAVVAPTYVMCPASKLRASTTPYDAYLNLLQTIPEENLFFAGDGYAYGFTPQASGELALSKIAVNCGMYDGSLLH